jgi:poly-gamma-glutamate capsule biosynthesis protein CapA/YwtB (metallophosphatase superfamily)
MPRFRLATLFLIFLSACQPGSGSLFVARPLTDPSPLAPLPSPSAFPSPFPLTPSPLPPVPLSSPLPSPSPIPLTPTPSSSPTPASEPITTLLFTGVIVPARCVQAALDARQDPFYPYEEVQSIIAGADLAVGTLNATISDYPPHTGCVPTYVLVGSAANADALAQAGFDVMSVATNHIKNCGLTNCGDRAFFDTLANLKRVGIQAVGAGKNHAEAMQPVVVTVNGVRFGIVSLGQIEPMAFAGPETPGIAVLTPENLRQAIAAARQVSDVVIAMPHWGPEDVPTPNYLQRGLAKDLVAAGADLVVGNHTHVVQALQEIGGVPVFYGLGNFVFDQRLRDHQQGVILLVRFRGTKYLGYELIPTHVDRDGRVHLADEAEAAEIMERVRQASAQLR